MHCSLCLSKQNYLHYLKKLLHIILKDEAVAKVHQLIFSRGAAEATCRTECTKDEEMEKRDKFEVGWKYIKYVFKSFVESKAGGAVAFLYDICMIFVFV